MTATPPAGLSARAHGKVNLGLEVLGRREDGYHEIRTVLQTIDIWDELRFEPAEKGVRLVIQGGEAPEGPENLVFRAASLLLSEAGLSTGAEIRLVKRLPAQAGLGGGSSDAAMTLLALDRLFGLGAPVEDLHRLASRLGMDVPFFLYGGTAVAVGRGDEVYPLDLALDFPIVLILPEFSISTGAAYANLRLTKREPSHKLLPFAWGASEMGVNLARLVNELEDAVGERSTSIREYKKLLLEFGAIGSMMSGSGSSVYGVFQDEAAALHAASGLKRRGLRTIATRTLGREACRATRLSPLPSFSSPVALKGPERPERPERSPGRGGSEGEEASDC